MTRATRVDVALRRGLDDLRRGLDAEREGAPSPADEGAWFRLVDEAARREGQEDLLNEIGGRFAQAFVDPYLHASDLTGVLREVGGLLSIHHRARLAVERASHHEAVVLLSTIRSEDGPAPPTMFERAVLRAAVRTRFPAASVEPEPCDDVPGCERLRIVV